MEEYYFCSIHYIGTCYGTDNQEIDSCKDCFYKDYVTKEEYDEYYAS